jgi:hypothetical protein
MKLIFLDFDGVLNSEASFRMEIRKKRRTGSDTTINETLNEICCSNFQTILEAVPDARIVISSAWRVFFTLDWLKAKLQSYGIEGNVVGVTGRTLSGHRGREISEYLQDVEEGLLGTTHTGIQFVVIDDSVSDLQRFAETGNLVATTWKDGLTLAGAEQAIKILGGKVPTENEMAEEDAKLSEAAKARREATRPDSKEPNG